MIYFSKGFLGSAAIILWLSADYITESIISLLKLI